MSSQLERALNLGYAALVDSLTETSAPVTISGIQGYRTTVVTDFDDALDGSGAPDKERPDYYEISIKHAWLTTTNVTDSVIFYFTPERSWLWQ